MQEKNVSRHHASPYSAKTSISAESIVARPAFLPPSHSFGAFTITAASCLYDAHNDQKQKLPHKLILPGKQ
jgi:hypothetical protein